VRIRVGFVRLKIRVQYLAIMNMIINLLVLPHYRRIGRVIGPVLASQVGFCPPHPVR
jgi:hypothetical protein